MALRILIVEDTPSIQEVLTRLCKDHAWLLVHTTRRAISLVQAYEFDLAFLDYDLAGPEKGDAVAAALSACRRRNPRVIVHTQNAAEAGKIQKSLPQADLVPFARLTRDNAICKRFTEELRKGAVIDWRLVFSGKDTQNQANFSKAKKNRGLGPS
jgi:CheY-like chemotaxis protein